MGTLCNRCGIRNEPVHWANTDDGWRSFCNDRDACTRRYESSAARRCREARERADSAIRGWVARIAAAEDALGYAVDDARQSGMTWEQVAAALGMSKQAAWQRFHHREIAATSKRPLEPVLNGSSGEEPTTT